MDRNQALSGGTDGGGLSGRGGVGVVVREKEYHYFKHINFLKRRLTPGQPADLPEETAYFPGLGGEHINFFVRLTGRLSQGQPDPDQSKMFIFMCLFLCLWIALKLHSERSSREVAEEFLGTFGKF